MNFQAVRRGELLAHDKDGEIRAEQDCRMLLPYYQALGDDGYFPARPVRRIWLGFRRLRMRGNRLASSRRCSSRERAPCPAGVSGSATPRERGAVVTLCGGSSTACLGSGGRGPPPGSVLRFAAGSGKGRGRCHVRVARALSRESKPRPEEHPMLLRRLSTVIWSLPLLLCGSGLAQCAPEWLPGDGFDLDPLPGQQVYALAEMPNGDLIAAGDFTSIGGVPVSHIARWNGANWNPLGGGVSGGVVRALAVLADGSLVAAGDFTSAGGSPAAAVARWDGSSWSGLGAGVSGSSGLATSVRALAVTPSGALVAGGHFEAAGGAPARNVASWDGTSWTAFGGGLFYPVLPLQVNALTVLQNGQVVAGTEGVSSEPGRAVQWTGSMWSTLFTAPSFLPPVRSVAALAVMPSGDLVVGGSFGGGVWQAGVGFLSLFFGGFGDRVNALCLLANGHLLAGGNFTATPLSNLAKWDGTTWSGVGISPSGVHALLRLGNGTVVTAGQGFIRRWGCGLARADDFGTGCPAGMAGSFYEHFPSTGFDLSNSRLSFSIVGNTYHVTHVPSVPTFDVPTAVLQLGDDDLSQPIQLPFSIPYPGGSTDQIQIGSNGYVFLQWSSDTVPYQGAMSASLFTEAPRHAAFWSDLDPSAPGGGAGVIYCDIVGTQVVATWQGVQEYGTPGTTATFQVVLSATGDVEYRYLACAQQHEVLCGWSPGYGITATAPTDLSAAGTSVVAVRLPLRHLATRPILGSQVVLTTDQLDPSSVLGINVIGFTGYDPGVDLTGSGMPGCFLHASLDLLFPFSPVAQSGSHSFFVPNQQSLIGVSLHAQGLAWDFPVNSFGMVSSNGVALLVGLP